MTVPELKAVRLRRAGRLAGHAWEQLELPLLAGADPLLCLGNLAPVARLRGSRAPVYTMVHDLSYRYFPDAYSRPFRLLYSTVVPQVLARSDRVFTVSHSEAAAIREHHGDLVGGDRLVAVQNGGGEGAEEASVGHDPRAFEPGSDEVPDVAARERRCLYVGSLTRRKNAEGLGRTAVELVSDGRTEFVFVGSTGSSFEQHGLAVPPELADRIHFLGQVNDPARIEAEYRRASVLVFPSFYEASPLPPVEAMRFGCPVVAGDIPSLRERCGEAALYCDPRDVGSIVRQARGVLDDGDRARTLQRRGLDRAAGYRWETQVRTVLEHIPQLG